MEWKTNAVFTCFSDDGERISVIEQVSVAADGQAESRYVLGNGQEIWKIHGSSYLDPVTGRDFVRVWRWKSGLQREDAGPETEF